MKATINTNELTYLVNRIKKFTTKSTASRRYQIHEYIKLWFYEDGTVKAAAVDGYSLAVEWGRAVNKVDKEFCVLIKPEQVKGLPENEDADITVDGKEARLECAALTLRWDNSDVDNFLNVDGAIPSSEPTQRIGINEKFMYDAMQSLGTSNLFRHPAIMEIRGELSAVVIKQHSPIGKENVRMILPVRLKERD